MHASTQAVQPSTHLLTSTLIAHFVLALTSRSKGLAAIALGIRSGMTYTAEIAVTDFTINSLLVNSELFLIISLFIIFY